MGRRIRHLQPAARLERPTRRLVIEQLEQRTYLASRIFYISTEDSSPTFYTSVTADPYNPKSLVYTNAAPPIVIAPGVHSVGPITQWLKLDDPTLTVSLGGVDDELAKLDVEILHDGALVGVRVQPKADFTTGVVRVNIRHLDDLDSFPPIGGGISITALKENPGVDLSLTATAPDGSPIDQLHVGDDFVLHVWSQDTRQDPHGVFATYVNLNWQSNLAVTDGRKSFGDHFSNGYDQSEMLPGAINRIGGFGGGTEWKGGRYEVFSVPMQATAAGNLMFSSNSVDDGTPTYNILEYGLDIPIDDEFVHFGTLSIPIADALPGQTSDDKKLPVEDKKDSSVTEERKHPNFGEPSVDLSLSATTPEGLPIDKLHDGDDFVLHVWAQDIRTDARGVFAAYLNLNWDSSLASRTGPTSHGEHFSNGKEDGEAAPGSLIHVCGFGGSSETMANRYEVFSVPMRATAAGELSIATSSALDGTPIYSILEHGLDGAIPLTAIQFGKLSIHIAEALPGELPTKTTDTPSLDSPTRVKNETPATPPTSIPIIVVTSPDSAREISFVVDFADLLAPELAAAIAGNSAAASRAGAVSAALLLKSAEAVTAITSSVPVSSDPASKLASVAAKVVGEAIAADESEDSGSTAQVQLSAI